MTLVPGQSQHARVRRFRYSSSTLLLPCLKSLRTTECLVCAGLKDLVLGIETSCDDTGVAVVNSAGRVLSDVIVNQVGFFCTTCTVVPKH